MNMFNKERQVYYQAKKREILRNQEADRVIQDDALFIRHYGMTAFLELFPDAKGFGILWHEKIIRELQIIQKRELAQLLTGIYNASAATKDKKANRRFRTVIRDLFRRK